MRENMTTANYCESRRRRELEPAPDSRRASSSRRSASESGSSDFAHAHQVHLHQQRFFSVVRQAPPRAERGRLGVDVPAHPPERGRHQDPPPGALAHAEHRRRNGARERVWLAEHELVRRADIILALRAVATRPEKMGVPPDEYLKYAPGARRYTVYSTKSVSPFCAIFRRSCPHPARDTVSPTATSRARLGSPPPRARPDDAPPHRARPPDLLLRPAVGVAGRGGALPRPYASASRGNSRPETVAPDVMACRRPPRVSGEGDARDARP